MTLTCFGGTVRSVMFLVAFLVAVSASGQPPSSLWLSAEHLATIFALDNQGSEHNGKLRRVDADQLAVLIDE